MIKKIVVIALICAFGVGFNSTSLIAQEKLGAVKYVEPPLDFEDTDLKTALISVFVKTGVQYAFDGEVSGKATIHLSEKMSLDDLLHTLLDPKGFFWDKDKIGVYHIGKSGVGAVEKPAEAKILITRIYPLVWANCLDMAKVIKTSLTSDGQVNTEPATNSVIVTDVATSFEGVEKIISQFDNESLVKTKLIVIRTKLIEISKQSATVVAFDVRYKLSSNKGGTSFNAVGAWGDPQNPSTPFSSLRLPGISGASFIWDLGIDDAFAALTMNTTSSAVNLVAEPELTVEDGTEAKIVVGQRYPIPSINVSQSTVTTTVTYEDINFTLRVTPKANKDGTISVSINPELKDIAGFSTITSAGGTGMASVSNDVPIINIREVKTKCYVKNGGTIKIGGMYKDKNQTSESKVPILGDIPLLGMLFKRYIPYIEKIEMVILLSPHIYDVSPPTCKETPWMTTLTATLETGTDVRIDWSKSVPEGAHKYSIIKYRIYRDDEPITSLEDRDPIEECSGAATDWMDTTKKKRGRTYYYVVTAINASDLQQAISTDPKYNAVITIPEEE